MNGHTNTNNQRKALRNGRRNFYGYCLGRLAIRQMLTDQHRENRSERMRTETIAALAVRNVTDAETGETTQVVLSELRRDYWPESRNKPS